LQLAAWPLEVDRDTSADTAHGGGKAKKSAVPNGARRCAKNGWASRRGVMAAQKRAQANGLIPEKNSMVRTRRLSRRRQTVHSLRRPCASINLLISGKTFEKYALWWNVP
jgi:hypothetical protein